MKITFNNSNKVNFYQEGGAMQQAPQEAPEQAAPEAGAEQGGDPTQMLMQLAQGAAQALQTQNADLAFQVCEGLIQFVQAIQGGQGGQEAEPAGEPVYRNGGQLVRRIRK